MLDCRPSSGTGILAAFFKDETFIRRRRKCSKGHRYTTIELNISLILAMVERDEVIRAAFDYIGALKEEIR